MQSSVKARRVICTKLPLPTYSLVGIKADRTQPSIITAMVTKWKRIISICWMESFLKTRSKVQKYSQWKGKMIAWRILSVAYPEPSLLFFLTNRTWVYSGPQCIQLKFSTSLSLSQLLIWMRREENLLCEDSWKAP